MLNCKLPFARAFSLKSALIHTIGCLSEHHGSKLLSLFPESVNLFTKQLKAARDADIPIRYETLVSLARTLRGAGRAATEPMIKELLKYARNGLNDKYIIIKSASAQVDYNFSHLESFLKLFIGIRLKHRLSSWTNTNTLCLCF